MNATVLVVPAPPRHPRFVLATLLAAALLALAASMVTGPATAPAGGAPLLRDPAGLPVEATVDDDAVTAPAEPAPRPARRHRQRLAMPFFSFAARS